MLSLSRRIPRMWSSLQLVLVVVPLHCTELLGLNGVSFQNVLSLWHQWIRPRLFSFASSAPLTVNVSKLVTIYKVFGFQ